MSTLHDLQQKCASTEAEYRQAVIDHKLIARAHATAEHAYRQKKATAFLLAQGTVDAKKMQADVDASVQMLAKNIADAERESSNHYCYFLKQILEDLRALIYAHKAEVNLA